MLAAVTARNNPSVDLFLVALLMADEKDRVSESLKNHFKNTLVQAKALIADPQSQIGAISPDAIKLALKIASDADVRDALEQVVDFEGLSLPAASVILNKMEHNFEGFS